MKQETTDLMVKAERAIHSAENTMSDGDYDFAVSRVYYAMFYIASALLGEKDLYFSKHGGVHGAFGQHFIKTGEFDAKYQSWLVTTFSQRIVGDYGATADFILDDVQEMIEQAREFYAAAQKYLQLK
ncbi:MAG: HEPN domain-containing protein [Chloroflexi bacterium]|nr:HEPN domain-containing protein [Chloroflexota bacterium]MBI3168757.1 HEPN domain-containing protein [Chloroflexota bacterium]